MCFRLAHEGTKNTDVEAVEASIVVADEVDKSDGDEEGEEDGVDVGGLEVVCVEAEGEEADGDMEGFAWNLVAVYLDEHKVSFLAPKSKDETRL